MWGPLGLWRRPSEYRPCSHNCTWHTLAVCTVGALEVPLNFHTGVFLPVRSRWMVNRDLMERFSSSWETHQTWKPSHPASCKAHGERSILAQGGKSLLVLGGENYFPVSSFPLWKVATTFLQIFTPSVEQNTKMACPLTLPFNSDSKQFRAHFLAHICCTKKQVTVALKTVLFCHSEPRVPVSPLPPASFPCAVNGQCPQQWPGAQHREVTSCWEGHSLTLFHALHQVSTQQVLSGCDNLEEQTGDRPEQWGVSGQGFHFLLSENEGTHWPILGVNVFSYVIVEKKSWMIHFELIYVYFN